MSPNAQKRGGFEIISELLSITRDMAAKSGDADFLVESIDKRELLMQEFDRLKTANPYAHDAIDRDKPEINKMIAEIIELDEGINRALISFREQSKRKVESSNSQKKILGYTNKAISSSGSYMDLKINK